MDLLTSHLRAMQTAAAASIVSAALLALPLLAAHDVSEISGLSNSHYANHIVYLFQRTGVEVPGTFTNLSIETSGFDFAAYMSHTCFRATKNDRSRCAEEFGPYANLKETYENGALHSILSEVSYLATAANLTPSPKSAVNIGEAKKTPKKVEESVRQESKKLWKACQIKEPSREAAMRCYQRNIRRTQEWNRGVEAGNVY